MLQFRVPSIPCGGVAAAEGYHFSSTEEKLASYFVAMDSMGKINENGCDLSYESYYGSCFFLPFYLSHELANYSADLSERVLQAPTVKGTCKARLFLEFNKSTEYVIRYKKKKFENLKKLKILNIL